MKKYILLIFFFLFCIESSYAEKSANNPVKSLNSDEKKINTSNLIDANFNFAVKIYHSMKTGDKNLFFSPYNISYSLSMLYPGAKNETAAQIKKALCYNYPDNNIPQSFKKLNDELINSTASKTLILNSASAVWGCKGSPFKSDFLNSIKENYNAIPETLDFANDPGGSVNKINQWVSDNTGGKIKNIINSTPPSTKLILAGALYFDAKWHKAFVTSLTKNEPFHLIDGKTVSVPMMNNSKFISYYVAGENYQALELPYTMSDYSMIIVLPKEGSFKKIENSITPEFLKSVITSLSFKVMKVKLPKFKYTSQTVSLNNILMAMGMKDAFTPSADFSGIFESENPFVSQVLHKAFVDVNETGTTAGAVTVVSMVEGREPIINNSFYCDRPFIYLIYNKKINTILFIGRMMNPKE